MFTELQNLIMLFAIHLKKTKKPINQQSINKAKQKKDNLKKYYNNDHMY